MHSVTLQGGMLLLLLLLVAPSSEAVGHEARRKLRSLQPNRGDKQAWQPVPNCYMVETVSPQPAVSLPPAARRSQRRLLTHASAEHTDTIVAKAKAALGEEAVVKHHSLGPVFPGFSIHTRDEGDAARLVDFLEDAEEVVAYRQCVNVPAAKPASDAMNVGPPPISTVINGVYESDDGADARRIPGYADLYGQGVVVAVVDSGIDYRHPGLGGCIGPRCKVIGGYDFVGNSGESPALDPRGCASFDHGTQVSGIIAANYTMRASGPNSTSVSVQFLGVAPRVRLLAYRVFACVGGGAEDSIIAAAILKAFNAGAHIINLSLGAAGMWESASGTLEGMLSRLGVIIVQAQGNDAADGLFMGSEVPASNASQSIPQITAGSVDDTRIAGAAVMALEGGGENLTVGTFGSFVNVNVPPINQLRGLPLRLTVSMSRGRNYDTDACDGTQIGDMTGAIALVRRGTCTFEQKALNVLRAGARAIIFWNRDAGPLTSITIGNASINFLSVSGVEGDRLAEWVNRTRASSVNITIVAFRRGLPGGVSSFSTWGPTADLRLTPDFTAPGGSVFTLAFWDNPTTTPPTTLTSGTSFAAPYIAACAALYLQAAWRQGLEPTPTDVRDALAMTSRPILVLNSSTGEYTDKYYTPLRAGSGRISLPAALQLLAAPVTIRPATLLLPTGLVEMSTSFTITNNNSATLRFSLNHIPTDSITTDDAMKLIYDPTQIPARYDSVTFVPTVNTQGLDLTVRDTDAVAFDTTTNSSTVTVSPMQTVTVQVTFRVPEALRRGNYLVAGYIIVAPEPLDDATTLLPPNLTLPYLGYTSRFTTLPVLKPDAPGGLLYPPGTIQRTTSSMVLFDADGSPISPFDQVFDDITRGGLLPPPLPQFLNNMVDGNMPILFLNLQHQFTRMDIYLVRVDPRTGQLDPDNALWVGDESPSRNSVRRAEPFPILIPTTFLDFDSGYRLPIPDGFYVAAFQFQRVNAVADIAAGLTANATERWISPVFLLGIPQYPSQ